MQEPSRELDGVKIAIPVKLFIPQRLGCLQEHHCFLNKAYSQFLHIIRQLRNYLADFALKQISIKLQVHTTIDKESIELSKNFAQKRSTTFDKINLRIPKTPAKCLERFRTLKRYLLTLNAHSFSQHQKNNFNWCVSKSYLRKLGLNLSKILDFDCSMLRMSL